MQVKCKKNQVLLLGSQWVRRWLRTTWKDEAESLEEGTCQQAVGLTPYRQLPMTLSTTGRKLRLWRQLSDSCLNLTKILYLLLVIRRIIQQDAEVVNSRAVRCEWEAGGKPTWPSWQSAASLQWFVAREKVKHFRIGHMHCTRHEISWNSRRSTTVSPATVRAMRIQLWAGVWPEIHRHGSNPLLFKWIRQNIAPTKSVRLPNAKKVVILTKQTHPN